MQFSPVQSGLSCRGAGRQSGRAVTRDHGSPRGAHHRLARPARWNRDVPIGAGTSYGRAVIRSPPRTRAVGLRMFSRASNATRWAPGEASGAAPTTEQLGDDHRSPRGCRANRLVAPGTLESRCRGRPCARRGLRWNRAAGSLVRHGPRMFSRASTWARCAPGEARGAAHAPLIRRAPWCCRRDSRRFGRGRRGDDRRRHARDDRTNGASIPPRRHLWPRLVWAISWAQTSPCSCATVRHNSTASGVVLDRNAAQSSR